MKLRIEESEIRSLVTDYLKKKGLNVNADQLIPTFEIEGEYEERIKNQTGYEVEIENLTFKVE